GAGARFPRLRRKPNAGIRRTETSVSAALHDLEEKPLLEGVGIDLEEFAGIVAIVEDAVFLHRSKQRGIKLMAAFNIIVVAAGNRQEGWGCGAHRGGRLEDVVAAERDVLDAGAEEFGQESRRHGLRRRGGIEDEPKRTVAVLQDLALHQPQRIRDLELR